VTTLAGTAGAVGYVDATGSAARFQDPAGLAIDAAGNLFVADRGNDGIRKVTPGGVVTTFAGGSPPPRDGFGAAAGFDLPIGLAIDSSGALYVTEHNLIRKISPAGFVMTIGGQADIIGTRD